MRPEAELALTEEILDAEVDLLQHYNQLLERGLGRPLIDLLAQYRADLMRRIETLQGYVRTCRNTMEAT